MSIRTLMTVGQLGPVTINLVEVTDEQLGKTVDHEVQCDAETCERYACTHLTEQEAMDEAAEHALTVHSIPIYRCPDGKVCFGGENCDADCMPAGTGMEGGE